MGWSEKYNPKEMDAQEFKHYILKRQRDREMLQKRLDQFRIKYANASSASERAKIARDIRSVDHLISIVTYMIETHQFRRIDDDKIYDMKKKLGIM